MSFSVGQKAPTSNELLISALAQGGNRGIQQSLAEFQEKKKSRAALSGLRPLFKQADIQFSPEEEEEFLESGINPQIAANFATDLYKQKQAQQVAQQKEIAARETEEKKLLQDQKELMQKGNTYKSILSKMQALKKYAGSTKIPFTKSAGGHIPYTEAAQKRAQINTLRLSLEGLFRDLTLKGQFPKAIYERILNELPSDKDSERIYQGKLDAINDMVEAHFGQSEADPEFEEANIKPAGKKMSLEEIFG